jgi:hypothetical protein
MDITRDAPVGEVVAQIAGVGTLVNSGGGLIWSPDI